MGVKLDAMCEGCVHPPHLGECRGYRQPLCSRDDAACHCQVDTPLQGQCGDDPREWLGGVLMGHRGECGLYGTITVPSPGHVRP